MWTPRNPKINKRSDSTKGEGARANGQMPGEVTSESCVPCGNPAWEGGLDSSVANLQVKQKDIKMRGKNALKISHMSPQHPSSSESSFNRWPLRTYRVLDTVPGKHCVWKHINQRMCFLPVQSSQLSWKLVVTLENRVQAKQRFVHKPGKDGWEHKAYLEEEV